MKIDLNITLENLEKGYQENYDSKEINIYFDYKSSDNFYPSLIVAIIQKIGSLINGNRAISIYTNLRGGDSIEGFLNTIWSNPLLFSSIALGENVRIFDKFKKEIKIRNVTIDTYNSLELIFKNEDYSKIISTNERLLSLADDKKDISNDTEYFKKRIKTIKTKTTKLKNDLSALGNLGILLASFDSIPLLKYPNYFYDKNLNVKKNESLVELIRYFFLKSAFSPSHTEILSQRIEDDLATILTELYSNTHDWGAQDLNSRLIPNNIRSSFFKIYELGKFKSGSINIIKEYLNGLDFKKLIKSEKIQLPLFDSDEYEIGIVELSVLDLGIGLAAQYQYSIERAKRILSPTEEIEYSIKCFQKGITSDTSSINDLKGLGLPRVLEKIGTKGFLYVRTGRTLLYRNFNVECLNLEGELFARNIHLNASTYENNVLGTQISILYPFLYKKK